MPKATVYWHLYMNIGDAEKTIDLTPGATHGVLFDGMTEDGSKVFFTTTDPLTTAANQDTDTSADIYQAQVSEAGALTLTRISTGEGRLRQHRLLLPASTGTPSPADQTATPSRSAAAAVSPPATARSIFSRRSCSTAPCPRRTVQNSPTSTLFGPGLDPHYVTTLETREPGGVRRGQRCRHIQVRRLPGHPRTVSSRSSPRSSR